MQTLDLVTPAAEEPLTLAAAKLHLRVTGGFDDDLITALIQTARQLAEEYTGLSLAPQGFRLVVTDAASSISLPRGPVTAVTSVMVDGQEAAYTRNGDTLFLPVAGAVTVEYTSGFDTCPAALLQAMLQITAQLYRHRGDDGGDALAQSGAIPLLQPFRKMRIA